MQAYTHILWDFNGTVLDDVKECLACADRLLQAHHLPPLGGLAAYRRVFGFPIIDYYRRMGFDFSKVSYDELAIEWVGYYRAATQTLALCPGVEEALARLKHAGYPQLILSATHRELLRTQLEQLGIGDVFEELLAQDNIHAHGKSALGMEWRARHPHARPVMIGDTDHDAEVAEKIGADCLLVCCGHQSRDTLLRTSARAVFDTPREAVEWILSDNEKHN